LHQEYPTQINSARRIPAISRTLPCGLCPHLFARRVSGLLAIPLSAFCRSRTGTNIADVTADTGASVASGQGSVPRRGGGTMVPPGMLHSCKVQIVQDGQDLDADNYSLGNPIHDVLSLDLSPIKHAHPRLDGQCTARYQADCGT
jgi:hypothetical protein